MPGRAVRGSTATLTPTGAVSGGTATRTVTPPAALPVRQHARRSSWPPCHLPRPAAVAPSPTRCLLSPRATATRPTGTATAFKSGAETASPAPPAQSGQAQAAGKMTTPASTLGAAPSASTSTKNVTPSSAGTPPPTILEPTATATPVLLAVGRRRSGEAHPLGQRGLGRRCGYGWPARSDTSANAMSRPQVSRSGSRCRVLLLPACFSGGAGEREASWRLTHGGPRRPGGAPVRLMTWVVLTLWD